MIRNLAIMWCFEIRIRCLEFGGIFAVFNPQPIYNNNPALFMNGDNGAIELDGLTCFCYFKLLISSLNDVFCDMRISSCWLPSNSAVAIILKFSLVCSPFSTLSDLILTFYSMILLILACLKMNHNSGSFEGKYYLWSN